MNNKDIETIQRHALHSIVKRPWDYTYRSICRWYSQTYATPLAYVEEELTMDHVLQHYYEVTLEKVRLSGEDLDAKPEQKEIWDKMKADIINGFDKSIELDEDFEKEDDAEMEELKKMIAEEEAAAAAKRGNKPQEKQGVNMSEYSDLNLFGVEKAYDETPPDYD